jgi:DNA adenine methylase
VAANGPLKWHGGKAYLAPWIHSLAPFSVNDDPKNGYTHRNYPFAGGLGELWGWECEGISEAANDLNGRLTDFWRVLGDAEWFPRFARHMQAIPFSQVESDEAAAPTGFGIIDRATAFFIRNRQSRQGLSRDYATPTTRTRRGMNENVSSWLTAVDGLEEWHRRFKRVEVRRMDACDFIRKYDHPRALFYCDPPYLHETRTSTGEYGPNEMTPEDHLRLLSTLGGIKGRFLLSGYPSSLYDAATLTFGWKVFEREIDNKASSKAEKPKRTEVVWRNF